MFDVILSPDSPVKEKYRAGFDSLREVISQDSNPVLLKYRLKKCRIIKKSRKGITLFLLLDTQLKICTKMIYRNRQCMWPIV